MNATNPPGFDNNANITPPSQRRPPHRTRRFWLIVLLIIVLFGVYRYYKSHHQKNQSKKPTQVTLATARRKDVPLYLSALGAVTPTYSVTVRTQINGILIRVLYKEGQMVKSGDLLAEIDPRPYEAQLVQYEGQLQRDLALLANALVDLKRYQTLWKQDSISQQTLATQESLVKQYQGDVQTDKGLIETTKINLIYCRITAPMDGRIGLRLVDPGNYVQTGDTNGIAVINTLNPITVIFTLPEDNIPDVMQKIYAGQTFAVEAFNRQQTQLLAKGNVLTIDNQIDPTTGTVRLRAQFANDTYRLFPSQFVNIRLLVKTLLQAIVVPTAAIQYTSAQETFVYALNTDKNKQPTSTVSVQPVVVGVTQGDDTVITSGIPEGQSVVVEGADNLTNGAQVTVATALPATKKMG